MIKEECKFMENCMGIFFLDKNFGVLEKANVRRRPEFVERAYESKNRGGIIDRKREGGGGGERRKWTLNVSLFTDVFLSFYFTSAFSLSFAHALFAHRRKEKERKTSVIRLTLSRHHFVGKCRTSTVICSSDCNFVNLIVVPAAQFTRWFNTKSPPQS